MQQIQLLRSITKYQRKLLRKWELFCCLSKVMERTLRSNPISKIRKRKRWRVSLISFQTIWQKTPAKQMMYRMMSAQASIEIALEAIWMLPNLKSKLWKCWVLLDWSIWFRAHTNQMDQTLIIKFNLLRCNCWIKSAMKFQLIINLFALLVCFLILRNFQKKTII